MCDPENTEAQGDNYDSATASPTLPGAMQSLCPWPRRRKVGSRLSMCEFATSAFAPEKSESLVLPPTLTFNRDNLDTVAVNLPVKPMPTDIQKRDEKVRPLYQALSEVQHQEAGEFNRRMDQLLKDLELEIRSFSIREAICKKPTVSMRQPKKSKLMTKRSVGF